MRIALASPSQRDKLPSLMNSVSKAFEKLLDDYFNDFYANHPADATYVGLTSGEGQFNEATLPVLRRQHSRRQAALAKLDTIAPSALSNEQNLDRLAFRARLLRECEDFEQGRHMLDPHGLDQVFDFLLREMQRGETEPKRAAKNIRSLLSGTPRYLTQAARLIERPERVWRDIMDGAFKASSSFFDAVASFLKSNGNKKNDALLIRLAKRACTRYHGVVMAKRLAKPGSFAIGTAMLQRRIRDELGLDYTVGQVEAVALSEIDRVGALLKKASAKLGRKKSVEAIVEAARCQWKPSGELLALYHKTNDEIIRKFKAAKAMTFPKGDSLKITLVPDFMSHVIPMAAYSPPGPFDKRQRGYFWVNDLGLKKKTEVDKLAERQQHFGLELTCAHEAYPGHHLQFIFANAHPRKWRRVFDEHAVFYEGWTLWCEQMCVDLGIIESPELKLQQLHDALWRCHRILVDLRLQTGAYSYAQAVRHMQKHLGFTKARAEADVNWYTGSPGVPMSYWLGRLENARLHRKLVEGRGWSLRRFNDWLLSFGTLPQSWIEKYGLN
jgi:uncharacterized protein (DUF885 family)